MDYLKFNWMTLQYICGMEMSNKSENMIPLAHNFIVRRTP